MASAARPPFTTDMQWPRFGGSGGAARATGLDGDPGADAEARVATGDKATRFAALVTGMEAAERWIGGMESAVGKSPAAREARLAALLAGVAAAQRRLEGLELAAQAKAAQAGRLELLGTAGTASPAAELPASFFPADPQWLRFGGCAGSKAGAVAPAQVSTRAAAAAAAPPVPGGAIPSSEADGAAPSPDDRTQELKVGAAASARGFSAATAAFRCLLVYCNPLLVLRCMLLTVLLALLTVLRLYAGTSPRTIMTGH